MNVIVPGFYKLTRSVNVNTLGASILMSELAVGYHARSLHHPVALAEVPPPHVLVGDLYDVHRGEPALLTV